MQSVFHSRDAAGNWTARPLAPLPPAAPAAPFLVGLDLGQVNDYSALAVAEQRRAAPDQKATYHVRHLQRWPLGTPYPQITQAVAALLGQLRPLAPPEVPPLLVVDQTGVGRPIVDLFRAAGLTPLAVTITGGLAAVLTPEGEWHVPKRDLVGAVQLLLQTRRLAWARTLPDETILAAELGNFRVTISPSGRDTYGAGPAEQWREGAHDDLVLAVALACWAGEQQRETGFW